MIRLLVVLAFVFGCLGINAQTQDNCAQGNHTSQFSVLNSQLNQYDSFFLEAMVQRQKGNNDAAFDLLRHCIEINPEASEAYYYLSQYYTLLKDNDKAMEMVRRAVELSPVDVTYQETLMDAYISRRDYKEAAAVGEAIYDRHKDREDVLELLFRLVGQLQYYGCATGSLLRL